MASPKLSEEAKKIQGNYNAMDLSELHQKAKEILANAKILLCEPISKGLAR